VESEETWVSRPYASSSPVNFTLNYSGRIAFDGGLYLWFQTPHPQGVVKKAHFRAVLQCDQRDGPLGLKVAHKLTEEALDLKYHRKMNVGLALHLGNYRPNPATGWGKGFYQRDCH